MRVLTLVLILCVALTLSCNEPATPHIVQLPAPSATPATTRSPSPDAAEKASAETLHIRTYEVPKGAGKHIFTLLRDLHVGRVQLAPNNRVIVVASESVQSGIADMLKNFTADDFKSELPRSIDVDYWLVLGQPAGKPQTQLPEIQAALDKVVEAQGPMRFTLIERASVQSSLGDEAETVGAIATFRQVIFSENDQIYAHVEVGTRHGQATKTSLRFNEGQFIVFGQVGMDPSHVPLPPDLNTPKPGETRLFFILRARRQS